MTETEDRILPLDLLRGAAILGVVMMNVAAIALPRALNIYPMLGGESIADGLVWLAQFVLVDGKARALLAMLFGASTLLVVDRAEMDGRDGVAAQRRRLLWLLPIGLAHYLLFWSGDILMLLAVCGLIALRFAGGEPLDLLKTAFLFFGIQFLLLALTAISAYLGVTSAAYDGLLQKEMVREIALHRDGYGTLLGYRVMDLPHALSLLAMHALPETLGFMMLGMAMVKGGFFTGQWTPVQYRASAIRAYLIGGVPLLALGIWAMTARDPRTVDMIAYAAAFPFRIPMTIAHAAALVALAATFGQARSVRAVAAVGRVALSNYLLCTLVMTSLVYGYGAGFYAHFDRLELLGLALLIGAGMMLWSPWCLAHVGRGPMERLWHRLQRVGTRA